MFCEPVDNSLPGSSVHGISQARILEWVAISFSRGDAGVGEDRGSGKSNAHTAPWAHSPKRLSIHVELLTS